MSNTESRSTRSSDHLVSESGEAIDVRGLSTPSAQPEVSVVVPTFNHRRFMLDLLDALSRQEGVRFEIIVVDDGSIDGTFADTILRAEELALPGKVVRFAQNRGRSTARNAGIVQARADVIAFIDSDCLPEPGWLRAGLVMMQRRAAVGVVQGQTQAYPAHRQVLFSHFIAISHFDGTFSTCNVFYRRQALRDVGGFDPAVTYWEDLDLGWRVVRRGWKTGFTKEARVYHQILPLTPLAWVMWPKHFAYMPEKAARYPEYRHFLFLHVWVHWFHALFDLAVVGLVFSQIFHRTFAILALPYVMAFPLQRGISGRWPPLKVVAHVAWDACSLAVLLKSSLKHRSLVL